MVRSLDDASTRAIRAEDQIRIRDEECRWLREQLVASQHESLTATRALANFGTQLRFGFKIYPDAPGIPVTPQRDQKPGIVKNPRAAVFDERAKAIAGFKAEGLRMWDREHGINDADTSDSALAG